MREIKNFNLFGESTELPDVVHCETIEARSLMHDWEFKAHRLLGIGPGFVPALFEPDLMDDIVTVRVEDAFATCRQIAAEEGLMVGITSGASAFVAIDLARRPENAGKTIVIVFADAGQAYMSVEGLFDTMDGS